MPLVGACVAVGLAPGVDIGSTDLAHDRIKSGIVADRDHGADGAFYGGLLEFSLFDALICGAHRVELDQTRCIHAPVIDGKGLVGVEIFYIDRPGAAAVFYCAF